MKRGLVIGGLIALATAATPVYDDYQMHSNAAEYLGIEGPWFPDPIETLGPVLVALVGLVLITRASTKKGGGVWTLAVGFGVIAALTIIWRTSQVAHYAGDATTFRMFVLPAVLAVALVGALVVARREN